MPAVYARVLVDTTTPHDDSNTMRLLKSKDDSKALMCLSKSQEDDSMTEIQTDSVPVVESSGISLVKGRASQPW